MKAAKPGESYGWSAGSGRLDGARAADTRLHAQSADVVHRKNLHAALARYHHDRVAIRGDINLLWMFHDDRAVVRVYGERTKRRLAPNSFKLGSFHARSVAQVMRARKPHRSSDTRQGQDRSALECGDLSSCCRRFASDKSPGQKAVTSHRTPGASRWAWVFGASLGCDCA